MSDLRTALEHIIETSKEPATVLVAEKALEVFEEEYEDAGLYGGDEDEDEWGYDPDLDDDEDWDDEDDWEDDSEEDDDIPY